MRSIALLFVAATAHRRTTRSIRFLVLLSLPLALSAQTEPHELPFESPVSATHNSPPPPGYQTHALSGCRIPDTPCGVITGGGGTQAIRRHVLQTLEAAEYRGKQIHYSAWLKLEAPKLSSATLFVRVERPSGTGLLRYDLRNPMRSREWEQREITGRIDADATRIIIGVDFSGLGSVQFSEPQFKIVEQ